MRYSYIFNQQPTHSVIEAREALGKAMRSGAVRDIDAAYERLELLDNAARRRRASAHHIRIVTKTLGTPDQPWEKFSHLVESFRKP